jgi:hypothetical protein
MRDERDILYEDFGISYPTRNELWLVREIIKLQTEVDRLKKIEYAAGKISIGDGHIKDTVYIKMLVTDELIQGCHDIKDLFRYAIDSGFHELERRKRGLHKHLDTD